MGKIESVFRAKERPLLITYLTMGYPHMEATVEAALLLEKGGADIIELGIPFSEPLMDGAVIQQASFKALQKGATPNKCLEIAREVGKQVEIPLVFMTYYNPVLQYGLEEFCETSRSAGIKGFIVPDLPPEEGEPLEEIASRCEQELIYLVAPGTPLERLKLIANRGGGFIYLASVGGLTGQRKGLPAYLEDFATRVRSVTARPICMGFGISTPEHTRQLSSFVDGIIVGSGIVDLMSNKDWRKKLPKYVRSLKEGMTHKNQG